MTVKTELAGCQESSMQLVEQDYSHTYAQGTHKGLVGFPRSNHVVETITLTDAFKIMW